MMRKMKQPGDEFGTELRRLRKARGIGAVSLSGKVGRGANYVGELERNVNAIPRRDVLLRMVEKLELSGTERERLLKLADRRAAPNGAKDSFTITSDPDANLFEALLRIDHDWPSKPPSPNPRSERAQLLIDAAAWVLAEIAAVESKILPPFTGIRWPEPLRRLGIVPDVAWEDAFAPAPELIEEELPFVGQLTENLTPMDAYTQSIGMARVYRRMLFNNSDATRELVSVLERWEYDRSYSLHDCISLIFRSRAHNEVYGFRDVRSPVIIDVAQRSLALVLWSGGQTRRKPIPWWSDLGIHTDRAMLDVFSKFSLTNYDLGTGLRQAIVCIRSRVWPYEAETIRLRAGYDANKVGDVEGELRVGELSEETHNSIVGNYWHLGGIEQQVLLHHARSMEARVPAPDVYVLWKPGKPFPEGHDHWKPGETTLTPRDTGLSKLVAEIRKPAVRKSRKSKAAAKRTSPRTTRKKKGRKKS